MEKKNTRESPGSSRESDVIIITPDELEKLGLFHNIKGETEDTKPNNCTELSDDNTEKKLIKKKIKDFSDKNVVKKGVVTAGLNILDASRSKLLNTSKNFVKNDLNQHMKILNSEIKFEHSKEKTNLTQCPKILNSGIKFLKHEANGKNKGNNIKSKAVSQTILNSKFLNKSLDLNPSKNETPARLSSTQVTHGSQTPTINPSSGQTKILNSEIKFDKRKFVIAQKKRDKNPIILNKQIFPGTSKVQSTEIIEKSIPPVLNIKTASDTRSVRSIMTKDSNKKSQEILNSKFNFPNINSGMNSTAFEEDLSSKNIKTFKKTSRRETIPQQILDPPIVIEDNENDLNENTYTGVLKENKKDSFKNVPKREIHSSQNVKNLEMIGSIKHFSENSVVDTIDLEKLEDSPPEITLCNPIHIKKEVNIIGNTTVHLSNEDLKNLVSKAKDHSQNIQTIMCSTSNEKVSVSLSPEIKSKTEAKVSPAISEKCIETNQLNFNQNILRDTKEEQKQEEQNDMQASQLKECSGSKGRRNMQALNDESISVKNLQTYLKQKSTNPINRCFKPEGEKIIKNIMQKLHESASNKPVTDKYVNKDLSNVNNDIIELKEHKDEPILLSENHENCNKKNIIGESNTRMENDEKTLQNTKNICKLEREPKKSSAEGDGTTKSKTNEGKDIQKEYRSKIRETDMVLDVVQHMKPRQSIKVEDDKINEAKNTEMGIPNQYISTPKKRGRKNEMIAPENNLVSKEEYTIEIIDDSEISTGSKGAAEAKNTEKCTPNEYISPKKRGRKKRIIDPENNLLLKEENTLEITHDPETSRRNSASEDFEANNKKKSLSKGADEAQNIEKCIPSEDISPKKRGSQKNTLEITDDSEISRRNNASEDFEANGKKKSYCEGADEAKNTEKCIPNEHILPKKRGRKKKIIDPEDNLVSKEENTVDITDDSEMSRRNSASEYVEASGKKESYSQVADEVKDIEKCIPNEYILPKKRGRKKKIIDPEDNLVSKEEKIFEITDDSEISRRNSVSEDFEVNSKKKSYSKRADEAKNTEKCIPNEYILPKKRGRKKKMIDPKDNLVSKEENTVNITNNSEMTGRNSASEYFEDNSKKESYSQVADDAKDTGKCIPNEYISPKKRGRKKKIIDPEDNLVSKEENILEITDDSEISRRNSASEDFEASCKKKSYSKGADESNNTETCIPSECISPKKRGRKKKIIDSEDNLVSKEENTLEVTDDSEISRRNSASEDLETNCCSKEDALLNELEETPQKSPNQLNSFKYADSKTPKENSALEVIEKIPKKRGQHRKETSSENHNENSIMDGVTAVVNDKNENVSNESLISTSNESHDGTIKCDPSGTPVTPSKKRGRPKKSVSELQEVESNQKGKSFNEDLEKSVNGRKRKKINYFEMENSSIYDESNTRKVRRKHKLSELDNDFEVTPKKVKICSPEEEENTSIVNSSKEVNSSENISGIKICEEQEVELISDDKQKDEDEIKCDDNNSIPEKAENKTQKTWKNSKYKKTGENAQMLTSIFTAAIRNSLKNDSSNQDNSSKDSEPSTTITVTSHDRRKKTTNVVTDEDNNVTCMSCNKKIDYDQWDKHNRAVHYDLAWREGELELNLTDPQFLTKTLRPVLKENKKLICQKCGNAHTSVEAFISHTDKCNGIVSSDGLVTCAVCKLEIQKSKWAHHKQRIHNNLAWRIGDHPLNLNDKSFVLNILNALYKAKKPLYCAKCKTTKKSVYGFLSHQSQCGVNIDEVKIKCEFCDKKCLPISMPTHVKMVHETSKESEIDMQSPNYFDNVVLTSKRKAAKKAMMVIDRFSKEKTVQEYAKHFLQNVDFKEEPFVTLLLQKELMENHVIRCKFNGCEFENTEVRTLVEHMDICENKPDQYYICKKCLLICDTEDEMKKHIKTAYDIDIIDDDFSANCDDEESEDDDEENGMEYNQEKLRKRVAMEKKRSEKDGNFKMKPVFLYGAPKKPGTLYPRAFEFTMELCEEHFSQSLLFDDLRYSEWTFVEDDELEEYMPKFGKSCDVARIKGNEFKNVLMGNYTFKRFEMLDAEVDDGIATIYCGGPIYAMAWAPTPYTALNSHQVLAVAAGADFDNEYRVHKRYKETSAIQFWDFGVLKNNEAITKPELMLILGVDFGPVWHMEWCPSGCYDIEENECEDRFRTRIGLLAVAGSDGAVYIYSIPFLKGELTGIAYKLKPVLKLFLISGNKGSLGVGEFWASKISWTLAAGHKYIAVGYTDGMVGVFDLNGQPPLLRERDVDGVDVILPFKRFHAHTHAISALSLIHMGDGKRWLLTGSFDRETVVWDLKDNSKVSSNSKKHIVTDGVWLPNWLCFVTSADESGSLSLVHTYLTSYRDYMYERICLLSSLTTVHSISHSMWLNGIIQGNDTGEIYAAFPHQLLYCLDTDKNMKYYRYFFGCAKLIDKHKTPEERVLEEAEKLKALNYRPKSKDGSESPSTVNLYNKYEPITYREAVAKYGILFCDKKMDKFSDFLTGDSKHKYKHQMEESKPNLYSMHALNKIAFNPNLQATLYYATGYKAGFVRLTYMKFLEGEFQKYC